MCPAKVENNAVRGFVIPIGGAEERQNDPVILQRFVNLCGDSAARIAIIPTASQLDETGPNYEKVFLELGAGEAFSLPVNTREEAQEESFLEKLNSANGIHLLHKRFVDSTRRYICTGFGITQQGDY